MITYVVAGSSKNPELAELENLCSRIAKNFENINFKIIAKHEKDWDDYIKQICKIYGFKEMMDPICFTPQGELLGSGNDFKSILEEKYMASKLQMDPLDETTAEINEKLANDDYEYRHRVITLKEKVKSRFDRLLFKDKFNLNKEIFEEIDLGKFNVYIKYLDRYTPQLIIDTNVITSDEYLQVNEENFDIMEAIEKDRIQVEEETHVDNLKTKVTNASKLSAQEEGEEKSKLSKSVGNSKAEEGEGVKSDEVVEGDNFPEKSGVGEEEVGEEEEKGPTTEDLNRIKVRQDCLDALANLHPIQFNLREWLVEKFDECYYLTINPESVFEWHSLLIRGDKMNWNRAFAKEKKPEEIEKEMKEYDSMTVSAGTAATKSKVMMYYDFSKTHKIRVSGDILREVYEQESDIQNTMSNIYSRFYDPYQPFSMQDLTTYLDILKDLDAYGFYRVVPRTYDDQKNFMNFTPHVILRESFLKAVNQLKNTEFNVTELEFEQILDNKAENLTSEFDLKQKRDQEQALRLEEQRLVREEEERKQFLIDAKKRREEEERLARLDKDNTGGQDTRRKGNTVRDTPTSSVKGGPSRQNTIANPLQSSDVNIPEEDENGEGMVEIKKTALAKSEAGNVEKEGAEASPKFSNAPSNFGEAVQDMIEEEMEYHNPFIKEFYRMNDWQFPHKIYYREPSEDYKNLLDVIEHMVKSFEEEEEYDLNDIGFNFIIGQKYLIMIPILTPYMDYGGNKLYLEPWSYLGFFTLPKLEKLWPATKTISTSTENFKVQNPIELFNGVARQI